MISIKKVKMKYPVPKRYREYLLHPFKRLRYVTALNEISLEIDKGERIALLGPNGAGKTTLLKLVCGLLLPSEGSVTINGYNTIENNAAARKSVGFVMNEERSFYWRLTGKENLEFYGALDNLSGKDLNKKIEELVTLVGLENAINKRVATYSSGMKQRLAIARGLLSDPDILILDEPTRTLDPLSAEEQINLIINRIHSDLKKTLLIATHRLEEVSALCNRVCVIIRGEIVSQEYLSNILKLDSSLSQYYRKCVSRN